MNVKRIKMFLNPRAKYGSVEPFSFQTRTNRSSSFRSCSRFTYCSFPFLNSPSNHISWLISKLPRYYLPSDCLTATLVIAS